MADVDNKANNEDTGGEGIPTAKYDGSAIGPGGQIGPYKLLRILGEGGYGIVYLAEQQKPVKRRVALKVIKPGMDTKQVIARFEAERQALALLDHPNIAHVFNAGTTDAGRPYFAMEYVKGVPITEHCDRYKLTIEERLRMFLSVCEAVQHAHQKAIIHRDIKPSNILVAYEAEQAVPMIIDFGVAKALTQSLTERTLVTEQAQMIGTPEYMSPEQAEMTTQDIDTRTDIYSLGVVLYELLTGTLPFDPETLRKGGPEQMRRMIREQDPQTPSARLSTIERDESLSLADHRRTDIRSLGHRLHGELDWITLKAMDKDRTRRYQTAHTLAEDIQRYLNQEPVLAGPPSTAYKLRKFIKRNRALFASSAAIAAILILAVIVSTQQAWIARKARRAESVERKAAQVERDRAQEAEQQAQQNLYNALVREAHATRIAHRTGYRDEVFKALQQARDLDIPQRNLAELRREAVACMGDFVGLKPQKIAEYPDEPEIWWATLHPTDPVAAFALSDGTILLKDVHSTKSIARFDGEYPPHGLCFAGTGNTLLSLHMPGAYLPEVRPADTVARLYIRAEDGTWTIGKTIKMPYALECISTAAGFNIVVADQASHSVQIFNAISGSTIHRFDYPEQMDTPPVVSLTADGRLLAIGSVNPATPQFSVLEIWDLSVGKRIHRIEPGLARCSSMKFSPDGRYLAFLSWSGGVIYSTKEFKPVEYFVSQFTDNSQANFLPDSTVVVLSGDGNTIDLWDWEKKEYLARMGEGLGGVSRSSVSVDGKSLLVYQANHAWLCTLDITRERLSLSGHSSGVPGVAFSPDGSRLASVGKDRKLRVWNSTTGFLEWERTLEGQGQSVAYNTDGRWLVTAEFDSERICVWDTNKTELLFQFGSNRNVDTWSAQFSGDSRYIVTATARAGEAMGAVTIWDITMLDSSIAESGYTIKALVSIPGRIRGLVPAPDGRQFAFVDFQDWSSLKLYVWEFPGTNAPHLITGNIRGWGAQIVTFTPDSQKMLIVDADRSVVTFDVSTGRRVASFSTTEEDHKSDWPRGVHLSLSPDGTKLALESFSTLGVDLWHREAGRLLYTLPEQAGSGYWNAWSPDGQRLAVSRSNGAIDIWNLAEIERILSDLGLAP